MDDVKPQGNKIVFLFPQVELCPSGVSVLWLCLLNEYFTKYGTSWMRYRLLLSQNY